LLKQDLIHEKFQFDDTRLAKPKKPQREIESIGDLSSNFSRIDGRSPMFFEGSETENNQRERIRKNLQNISSIDPSPITKTIFMEDGDLSDKQKLRRQIRTLEDEVIALKKLYREKLEARVVYFDPGLGDRHRFVGPGESWADSIV
jgi:hypothetical protein